VKPKWFQPNITRAGRLLRGSLGLLLLGGAAFAAKPLPWLGVVLLVSGLFVLFEAARGWCVMRACGIKTKL
jgi:hypothetical protein